MASTDKRFQAAKTGQIKAADIRAPKPVVKLNPIQAQITLRHLRDEVKQSPEFAKLLQENPIEVFMQFGFSKKAAASIIAQEIGLGERIGVGRHAITTCCVTSITTCCVTSKGIFDQAIKMNKLPDVNNVQEWKALTGVK